jgi:hypothetical protein
MKICSIKECGSKVVARGFCVKHWTRWHKYGDPHKVNQIRGNDQKRFWSKVNRKKENDCWIWQAGKMDGYGYFRIGGRTGRHILAHRYSWEIANGAIPKCDDYHGNIIMHICDNRACVNPLHLTLGKQSDNVKDMDNKGRRKTKTYQGEQHHNSRFTDKDIRYIRRSSKSNAEIAREFSCARQVIGVIRKRITWKHI